MSPVECVCADEEARERLQDHPRSLGFPLAKHLTPQLFDFPAQLNAKRMLLPDCDVPFFAKPNELLRRIEGLCSKLKTGSRDVSDVFDVSAQVV